MTVFRTPRADRDFEHYKLILDLWARENPIKNNNLIAFLVVQSLLFIAVNLGRGFTAVNWPLYLGGAILSLIWLFPLGRTAFFQKCWGLKLQEYVSLHPTEERFNLHDCSFQRLQTSFSLRFWGGLPSTYLLGVPLIFGLFWLILLLYVVLAG